jgi:hypothetical protein
MGDGDDGMAGTGTASPGPAAGGGSAGLRRLMRTRATIPPVVNASAAHWLPDSPKNTDSISSRLRVKSMKKR